MTIGSKESSGSMNDFFEIKTNETNAGIYELDLRINYVDSENREKIIKVPITIIKGWDSCSNDNQCSGAQVCEMTKCVDVKCTDGYVRNHECIKYECVTDFNCDQYNTCDIKLHICKPPECTENWQCVDNEVCGNGKCQEAFTLVVVPLGISENKKEDYYQYSKNEMDFFRDNSPLRESKNDKKSLRVHYINPSLCSSNTKCSYSTSHYCYEETTECIRRSGLSGIANKVVSIVDNSMGVCGFAWIGGNININKLDCKATPAHELGHNFGLYHIEPKEKPITSRCGKPAGACSGVNAEDCKDSNAYRDIMSYCSPEDHFGPQAYNYMKIKYFSKYLGG